MRHATLAARIARLEARHRPRRSLPRLAYMVHEDDAPETTVEAFETPEGIRIPRNPGEALSDLLARAWRHDGVGRFLYACYPPDVEPVPVEIAPTVGTPTDVDPFALAGVGRAATVAELTHIGGIPTPAERLN